MRYVQMLQIPPLWLLCYYDLYVIIISQVNPFSLSFLGAWELGYFIIATRKELRTWLYCTPRAVAISSIPANCALEYILSGVLLLATYSLPLHFLVEVTSLWLCSDKRLFPTDLSGKSDISRLINTHLGFHLLRKSLNHFHSFVFLLFCLNPFC